MALFATDTAYRYQPISWQIIHQQAGRFYRHQALIFTSLSQWIRDSSLTETDLLEIARRRGKSQYWGFAYQLGFVRTFQ